MEEINMLIQEINMISKIETPYVELKIYPLGWDKTLQVISFMDTDAADSILNLNIVPDDHWAPHFKIFVTTSKEGFLPTKMITKQPVMIEFFLSVLYKTKILGSNIPGKDMIIVFYTYRQLKNCLIILTERTTFMVQFRRYSIVPRLFQIIDEYPVKKMEKQ
ncbi:hypothetical protein CQW23_19513 [Capsicum baccatum]|uniref:Uncharacterized protein n=1 Tax=Capsicum baccatum TaxID=33114 RepID=A0A2G2W630_CAPBA|nr:hypothetical protein CQW23_19513 [Capsicum baccatum]